jgi:hypothetical protein
VEEAIGRGSLEERRERLVAIDRRLGAGEIVTLCQERSELEMERSALQSPGGFPKEIRLLSGIRG